MTYFGGSAKKKLSSLHFLDKKSKQYANANNKKIKLLTSNIGLNKKKFIKFGRVKKKHLIYQLEIWT